MPQIYGDMHDKYLIECFDNIVMNLRVDGSFKENHQLLIEYNIKDMK